MSGVWKFSWSLALGKFSLSFAFGSSIPLIGQLLMSSSRISLEIVLHFLKSPSTTTLDFLCLDSSSSPYLIMFLKVCVYVLYGMVPWFSPFS